MYRLTITKNTELRKPKFWSSKKSSMSLKKGVIGHPEIWINWYNNMCSNHRSEKIAARMARPNLAKYHKGTNYDMLPLFSNTWNLFSAMRHLASNMTMSQLRRLLSVHPLTPFAFFELFFLVSSSFAFSHNFDTFLSNRFFSRVMFSHDIHRGLFLNSNIRSSGIANNPTPANTIKSTQPTKAIKHTRYTANDTFIVIVCPPE